MRIKLGKTRIVMRGPMFPSIARFADGSLMIGAASVEEHSPIISIRSEDGGDRWRPYTPSLPTGAAHTVWQLHNGPALALSVYTQPLAGEAGWYATTRWESDDNWRTVRGPLSDGRLYLPPDRFDATKNQWFHGNVIEMPNGDLLSALQEFHVASGSRVYLCRSTDRGVNWHFVAEVASFATIDDPQGVTRQGWALWGPCEPNIAHVGGGRLICVMRLVNDDRAPLLGPPMETYHDLSDTISGAEIYRSGLPADRYFSPGPPSVPLVISHSADGGQTWSPATPLAEACGCQPRLAQSDGILALTFGALAFPRWGNCITCSDDGGRTWSEKVQFGPYLTTGYTGVVAIAPRHFLCVFDCTPPQPWLNHAAHWVGVVDVEVNG